MEKYSSFLFQKKCFFTTMVCIAVVCAQNFEGGKFPEVGIYRAEDFGSPQPSNPKYVITNDGEKRWLGLLCNFHRPIRWVYQYNEQFKPTYSMQIRSVDLNNFNDTTFYAYEAALEIEFEASLAEEVYLACVGYEDSTLMTFVTGKDLEDQGFTEYVVWNNTLEEGNVNNSKVLELIIPSNKISRPMRNNSRACSLEFTYDTEFDIIYFQWSKSSYASPFSVADATTLENYRRNIPEIEEHCRNKFEATAYYNASVPLLNPRFYQANIFYAENNIVNEKRVAKGVYSILKKENSPRKFYFLWEVIPMEEMYYIDMPDEIYIGETLNIETRVSPYFFSAGTVVSMNSPDEQPKYFSLEQIEPSSADTEQGTRISILSLLITKSVSVEMMQFYFPLVNSSKWFESEKKTLKIKESEEPEFLDDLFEDPLMFKEGDENVEISCKAKGSPPPDIAFHKPRLDILTNETLTKSINESILVITFKDIRTEIEGNYSCFATNFLNNATKYIFIEVEAKGTDTRFSWIIFAIFGVASIIFITIVVFLLRRIGAQKREYEQKTEEAIAEFLSGSENVGKKRKSDLSIEDDEFKLDANFEYNRNFEIPYASWHIGEQILGQGAFAIVTKGHLAFPDGQKMVAVKRIMSPSEIEDFKCALYELKLMSSVGYHPNILELMAACTDNIQKREVLMGLEYCGGGDLLAYLKKRRALFNNYVRNGDIHIETAIQETNDYSNVATSSLFTTLDLFKWSYQISHGMQYLESKHIIHGDLSARNLLLTDYKEIKISDFGLSRQVVNSDKKSSDAAHEALPWKWMSLEAIKDRKLSHKSDIWSMGVTLWEIFSLGEIPYPGSNWGPEFVERLEKGMRLVQSKFCPNDVYGLMVQSWDSDPEQRPSFHDFKGFFMDGIEQMASVDTAEYKGNSSIRKTIMEKKPLQHPYENDVQESQGTVEDNGNYYLCSEKL